MESVLNWLWQGVTVAIAAAVMLRFVEPSRTVIRYRSLWVVLLTILLLPAVPFLWTVILPARAAGVPASNDAVVTIPTAWWTSTNLVIGVWAAWFVVIAGRVGRAAFALRRAKNQCLPVPAGLEARLRCWSEVRTTGRAARLVLSTSVKSAAVLGGRSPFIAVAPALVDHLTDRELDRVVIHEWAHVQRRDDATHLLQLLVRALAGWHPAVWWCDRQLNVEREIACDEMAVAITGSTKEYAACLTRLASVPSRSTRPLAGAVALSTSSLHHRIVRILSFDRVSARPARAGSAIVAGGALIAAFSLGAVQPVGAERGTKSGEPSRLLSTTSPATERAANASASVTPTERVAAGPRRAEDGSSRASQDQLRADVGASIVPEAASTSLVTPIDGAPASVVDESHPREFIPSPLASRSAEVPAFVPAPAGPAAGAVANNQLPVHVSSVAPWTAAADAGVRVGRGTQEAAVTTAGVFNRLAKRIAGSF